MLYNDKHNTIIYGIGFSLYLNLVVFIIFSNIIPTVVTFSGLTQLIYLIPIGIFAFKKNRKLLGQGLIIGAGITFFLNTACYGFFGILNSVVINYV